MYLHVIGPLRSRIQLQEISCLLELSGREEKSRARAELIIARIEPHCCFAFLCSFFGQTRVSQHVRQGEVCEAALRAVLHHFLCLLVGLAQLSRIGVETDNLLGGILQVWIQSKRTSQTG